MWLYSHMLLILVFLFLHVLVFLLLDCLLLDSLHRSPRLFYSSGQLCLLLTLAQLPNPVCIFCFDTQFFLIEIFIYDIWFNLHIYCFLVRFFFVCFFFFFTSLLRYSFTTSFSISSYSSSSSSSNAMTSPYRSL